MEYVLSIDLGGTNLRVGIIDNELNIINVLREPTTKNNESELFLQISRMIEELDYKKYNIKKVGVSACGLIDHDIITILPNIGIGRFDLKKLLEDKFDFKVEIKNDANCTALAEATFGSTRDVKDSYFITISTGIGGGLIYNHKMIDLSFEIGQTNVFYNHEIVKFEHLCSGNGIVNSCKKLGLNIPHAGKMFELKDTNEIAKKVYDEWIKIVSLYIANIQIEYNVDKIVLSGGVMKSAKYFIDTLENKANKLTEYYPLKKINLVLAHFDQDAGLIGGASVAFNM